jgi:hypothetical protein
MGGIIEEEKEERWSAENAGGEKKRTPVSQSTFRLPSPGCCDGRVSESGVSTRANSTFAITLWSTTLSVRF